MFGLFLVGVGVLIAAIGMTTFVAGSSANRVELYRWITGGAAGARSARVLLAGPVRVGGSALGLVSAGTLLVGIGVRAVLDGLDSPVLPAVLFLVGVPAVLAVVYVIPGGIGRRWAEPTIKLLVPGVARLAAVFAPVTPRGFSVRPRTDLVRTVDDAESGEMTDSEELALVSGVLAFTERSVREVMTPRTDIVAVSNSAPTKEVGEAFAQSDFSRIPVYHDSLDNIVGMYLAFDLLKLSPGDRVPVRPVTMTPSSRSCADLLFEMQQERHHLAVVLDEYGGTAGIATLDDLLGDLVEELFETEEKDVAVKATRPVLVEVLGGTAVSEVGQQFGVQLPGGAETLGGFLTGALGRIPAPGERCEVAGLEFDILAATATRVERVAVRRAAAPVIKIKGRDTR